MSKKKTSVKKAATAKVAKKEKRAEEPVSPPRRLKTAHVPGPRRKPKFDTPPGYDPLTGKSDNWKGVEEETVAEAPAEAEVSDATDTQGKEKPLTFGSIDA
jgi:hypothetical protein